jgi:hypothetical protein
VTSGLVACSLSVSKTPLSNSNPEVTDVYFYGPAGHGGKELAAVEATESKPVVIPKPPSLHKPKRSAAKRAGGKKKARLADGGVPAKQDALAGRYLGTDTVVIDFLGIPPDPQVDEKAIVDIEKKSDDTYTLTVVASDTGDPLCVIEGKRTDDELAFAPGQECFSEILPLPLETTLLGGKATFSDGRISVEFGIDIAFNSPGGSIEGSVDYEFEGEKEPSDNAENRAGSKTTSDAEQSEGGVSN